MGVTIQHPPGNDVTVSNPLNVVYIVGNEFTDGSRRIIFIPGDNFARVELRTAGVWALDKLDMIPDNIVWNETLDHVLDENLNIVVSE